MMALIKLTFLFLSILNITACGQLMANAKKDFAQDLSATILAFDDPETIKKAMPSYLVLMSSMIKGDPENADLLESGAQLYGAYASSFADSAESRKALANRAFDYASRATCIKKSNLCDIENIPYFEFEKRLATVEKSQAESLFVLASSWGGVIQESSADWNAIADLPKLKASIQRVLELDETVGNGNAHLSMAVMESLLPPSLGGKPEIAKKHFERAIEISDGENLMAKVFYAERYARMLFDRELHDELLQQVIAADVGSKHLLLINTLAKQKAARLLLDADDYF